MPVVLTYNTVTESQHVYDDKFGEYYSYPRRYQRLIRPGMRALFYSGRRTSQEFPFARYVGNGIIGKVVDTGEKEGRSQILRCETLQVVTFPKPVPVKGGMKDYFESRANEAEFIGLYFQAGVRGISVNDYKRILRAAVDLDPVEELWPLD